MTQIVFIADNPLDLSSWEQHVVEDIHEFNKGRFPKWPPTARVYHGAVAHTNDVTPHDEASAQRLGSYPDPLYIVVYPAWAQVAAAAVMYAVAWVVTQLTSEKMAMPKERQFANGSPSNSLSDRENRARLMERVPDGFGTIRCIPDLIAYTYTVWEKHRAVEYSLMCVGRNGYAVTDIRENDTLFSGIADASAVVYPPGEFPGGGTPQLVVGDLITEPAYAVYPVRAINGQDVAPMTAFYCYGSGLNLERVQKFPGQKYVKMSFIPVSASTGIILCPHNGDPEFVHSRIRAGDELQVIFGVLPTGGGPIPDLSAGFYFGADPTAPGSTYPPGIGVPPVRTDLEALVVTNTVTRFSSISESTTVEVHVTIPGSLQAEWAKIAAYTPFTDLPTGLPVLENINAIVCAQNRWLLGYSLTAPDPASRGIFIDDPDSTEVWLNLVAPRGLYCEDSANRRADTATFEWILQPCDADGLPTADPLEFGTVTLKGSMIGGETRAVTLKIVRTTPGRALLLLARTSARVRQVNLDKDTVRFFRTETFDLSFDLAGSGPDGDPFPETAFTGTVVDDVTLNECYSMSVPAAPVVGVPVTLIHSRVIANQSATRIERRQLNCRVSRNTGTWNGAIWQPLVIDTQGFIENILFEAMLDPFIGNRQLTEIDFAGIAAAALAVRAYFGDEDATRFSYFFDDHNTSFEETILTMAQACFLTPYRQANLLKCDPDIATDNSNGLFNHRNKMPGTEQRTVSFGLLNDNDGVEQQYTDVNTGADNVQPISQFLSQSTVVAPVQSRIVGLRFKTQAWWHAYRQLARLIYQSVAVEFDALDEAALVGLNQRILVEDNTKLTGVQDGDIIGVSGLVLRTSQPVAAAPSATYTVFLQGEDGTVESRPCTPGTPDGNSITLALAPVNPIRFDPNSSAVLTSYILVQDQDAVGKAMLVVDKQAKDRHHWALQAINYSHMYYHADGLTFWMVPSTEITGEAMFDRSPYERPNLADDTFLGSDAVWGPVYDSLIGFLTNSNFGSHLIAYSKFCWVKKDALGTNATILSTAVGGSPNEFFAINSSNQLVAGHNGTNHCQAAPPAAVTTWVHYGVVYNSITATMEIYGNGEQIDTATSVPTRTLSGLAAFNSDAHGALNGQAKHLRHYARAFTPSMVRELYQRELLLP